MYLLVYFELFIILVTRKRSLKRPAALRDYVTEEHNVIQRDEDDDDDTNEKHLVQKVRKAYSNLKRIQKVCLNELQNLWIISSATAICFYKSQFHNVF